MSEKFKLILEAVKPYFIKFQSLNPIIKWSAYILGSLGLNRLYNFLFRKINNYPPGNYGIPIFGNLFLLAPSFEGIMKDAKKYKTLSMTYYPGLFGLKSIAIYDLDIAKKIFYKDNKMRKILTNKFLAWDYDGNENFADTNGHEWQYRRQLTHKALSLLVDSKYIDTRMNALITDKLQPILDEYSGTNNEYYFRKDLKYAMYQFLFVAFFGNNVEIPQRDEYKRFDKLSNEAWGIFVLSLMVGLFIGAHNPVGRYINRKLRNNNTLHSEMFETFERYVKTYKENAKNGDNNEDCYLARLFEHQKTSLQFSERKLIIDMYGMFLAGYHVTLGQMETVLYFAAKNESQQELVYNELREYYKDKPNGFELKHIKDLHYYRAFIYEVMRYNKIAVASHLREINQKGIKVGGYNLPKHCMVSLSIYCIHFNPKYFGDDCDKFNINRWLDDNKKFKMNPAFVIFGIGPRSCPAQSLALREIYSLMAPLLLRYKFTKPDGMTSYKIPENWFQENIPQLPLIVNKRQ